MPRIELKNHFTSPSFNYFRDNASTPFNFTKEEIPGFSKSALAVFEGFLQTSVDYAHPRISADKAIAKKGWTQIFPATIETGAKISTCGAIVAAGYFGTCQANQEICRTDSLPPIITENPESFTAGLIVGTTCGTLAELWSNVRRRWKEGEFALKELELALLHQSEFIKNHYKLLKCEMKEELNEIKKPVPTSPSKISPVKRKPAANPRIELLKSAFEELKKARDFNRKLHDRVLEGSSSSSEEEEIFSPPLTTLKD